MAYLVLFLVCALTAATGSAVAFFQAYQNTANTLADTRARSLETVTRLSEVQAMPRITRDMRRPGVYVIKAHGWCKIGRASDVGGRLDDYRTAIPRGFETVAIFYCQNPTPLEARLHKRFARMRRRGEWFYLSEETQEVLRQEAKASFKALSA